MNKAETNLLHHAMNALALKLDFAFYIIAATSHAGGTLYQRHDLLPESARAGREFRALRPASPTEVQLWLALVSRDDVDAQEPPR